MSLPQREQLEAIQQFDTCSILNAIETFGVRLRNEGYARPGLNWLCPNIGSILGYACTLSVKGSNPPMRGSMFDDRTDWWKDIESREGPCIAVVQDTDQEPGIGSVAGQVHAAIMQRLGCSGLVTNGSVRDIPAVERMGFAFQARSVSPSHAYGHVVNHNQPVEIYGLHITPGDLLFADRHGLISIPLDIAAQLPEIARQLKERDTGIIDFCRSPEFSLLGLKEKVK